MQRVAKELNNGMEMTLVVCLFVYVGCEWVSEQICVKCD